MKWIDQIINGEKVILGFENIKMLIEKEKLDRK